MPSSARKSRALACATYASASIELGSSPADSIPKCSSHALALLGAQHLAQYAAYRVAVSARYGLGHCSGVQHRAEGTAVLGIGQLAEFVGLAALFELAGDFFDVHAFHPF